MGGSTGMIEKLGVYNDYIYIFIYLMPVAKGVQTHYFATGLSSSDPGGPICNTVFRFPMELGNPVLLMWLCSRFSRLLYPEQHTFLLVGVNLHKVLRAE